MMVTNEAPVLDTSRTPVSTPVSVMPSEPEGGGALDGLARSFRAALASVERSERHVDRAVGRLSRGADLSTGELLALQTEVYRSAQRAELVSRAVDRVSDTVREITQIRV
jgi:methyl-accepting chemotaxis protein